ncbi:MAG TPA: HAD-IA family hydrolase [Caulobacteraceae bacterium]|nr:HAD-IA family hydrolase [Caulobacteraceae bacterium]
MIPSLDGAVIVFDLDGTLVDTAPDLIGTLNVMLAAEGLPPARLEDARVLIGRGGRALIAGGFAAAGRPLTDEEVDRRFEAFLPHYLAHIADLSAPYPGVQACLDELAAAGARLAVCTNKRGDLSRALLDAVGLGGRFAAVVGPDHAGARKPDPRHLVATIAAAGGRADQAVMVGDSPYDAQAARAAGVRLVLVAFGYSETPVADLGADAVIGDFTALPEVCTALLGRGK